MENDDYSHLFKPGRIGGVTLENRLVTAPMTRCSASPDGVANDLMVQYYTAYARGGFGLLITEGTYIDEKHSQGYKNQPGIANERQVEAWARVVEAVHAEGRPIFQQLLHAGALIQENVYVEQAIAPSAVQPVGEMLPHYFGQGRFPMPREITRDEIAQTIEGYAAAARRVMAAGFDGVEIHGANGYLPDQFLTTYTNLRTDEYGGPVEQRIRFHCEVLRAVKDAVGGKIPVGIRISQTKVNDFTYSWPGGVDDARVVFSRLAEVGPDYVHISTHKGLEDVFGTGRNLADWAKEISGLTIVACGALNDPERAERFLAEGQADFAAMAKGALADPAWPRKVAAGEGPVPFDKGMIMPVATIQNTIDWKRQHLVG